MSGIELGLSFANGAHGLTSSTRPQRGVEELQHEEAFSSIKYLGTALVIATIAAAILPFSFPAAIALGAIGSWYLWSATIIVLNRVATGSTCIENMIHRLHAIAMEVNSAITAAAVFPLTLFNCYHGPYGNLQGRPILMLNGYLSFGSTWYYQRQKLVEAGFGPIYTMNVGSGRSISTYANQVKEKVKAIQKETGRNDLALICHSKGGLVGSYYATMLAEANTRITDVVTIGSPLTGTPLATLGPGYDAHEMRTDSKFHQELRQKMKEHQEIRFFHIASTVDDIVPLSSALLGENPSRQLVLNDMGHAGLLFSSRVANQICRWLHA